MARNKAPKPLTEAPPEPDSSDDEGNSSSSSTEVEEGPEQQAQNEEVSSSSASSDDDDEEEETETEPQQQTPKKPQSATPKKPANESSDEEEEEEDDSPVLKPKPITSPLKSISKPRSKPIAAAVTPEKEKDKRPLEIEEKDKEKGVSSKKPRKEKEKEKSIAVVQEEGTKKQASVPFQRLYSADDEIAILKGMIEFRAKKGADPMFSVEEFYEFIKNSLHVDVNRGQVVDKIRRLKKRYYNSLDKKKKLTNPHEIKFFELCQKIWNTSDDKVGNGAVENSNLSAKSNSKARILKIKGAGNGAVPAVEEQKNKVEEEKEKDWKITVCDQKDVEMEIGEESSKERLRKKGMNLMGAKARAEISEMWDKVVMAQQEVDELRFNVLKEENKRIMEALKSGKQ